MRAGALLLALLAGACGGVSLADPADEYVVVVSEDVEVDEISYAELRRIFTFQKKFWKPGEPIKILVSEESLRDDSFLLQAIYRTDYLTLRRLVLEKLYQGEIEMAPFVLSTDAAVVEAVRSGRGLIALVRRPSVSDKRVKIVAIEGKRPGAPDYPLHARRWAKLLPDDGDQD